MMGDQELELQEWEYYIKSKKKRIIDITMLVPNKNPPGYKEHVIYFIAFYFVEDVKIIDWIGNIKLYVYDIVE